METDVHVGSSIVANNVTGIGRSASTKLIMDMGFVLEGRAEAELPEKVGGLDITTSLFQQYRDVSSAQHSRVPGRIPPFLSSFPFGCCCSLSHPPCFMRFHL